MDELLNVVLPIGSVVRLKGSVKNKMIVGYMSGNFKDDVKLYVGVEYPLGIRTKFMLNKNYFLFNPEEIDEVYYIGYQDKEYEEYSKIALNLKNKIALYNEKAIKLNEKEILRILFKEELKLMKEEKKNE